MSLASCEIRDGCSSSFFKPPGSIIQFTSAEERRSVFCGDFEDCGSVFIGWFKFVAGWREFDRGIVADLQFTNGSPLILLSSDVEKPAGF